MVLERIGEISRTYYSDHGTMLKRVEQDHEPTSSSDLPEQFVRAMAGKWATTKMAASDQTYGRFRPDMPNVWLKNQNGVSNYPMAYQINAASARTLDEWKRRWRGIAQRQGHRMIWFNRRVRRWEKRQLGRWRRTGSRVLAGRVRLFRCVAPETRSRKDTFRGHTAALTA